MTNQPDFNLDNLLPELQHRAAQLEALNQFSIEVSRSLDTGHVFSSVCQVVTRVVDAHRSAVFILDLGQGLISLVHAQGLSEEFTKLNPPFSFADDRRAYCLHTGSPDLVEDINEASLDPEYQQLLNREGISAVASYPLVSPDGPIGYLSVYFEDSHDFGSEELQLVQSFVAQAAMAVSNARLHERTDLVLSRRLRQLSVLETISRELGAAINSDQLFDMILNYSMEFTNSTWGMFSEYDPVRQLLQVKAMRGYREAVGCLALDDSIPGRAIQRQTRINVPDLTFEKGHQDFTHQEACSHLSVPLVHQSRVLGVLSLESQNKNAFSDSDVAFVGQLANQAAIALQNAHLFSGISTVRDRLSAVLNSVEEGILLFDPSGDVVLVNHAVAAITGLPLEEIEGRQIDALSQTTLVYLGFEPGLPLTEQLERPSLQRSAIGTPAGEKVLERSVIVVQGESEKPVGWMLVLRDVTDELRVAQERELISETLIHDLRSPVSAVLGALEVVETTLPAKTDSDVEMSIQALHVARRGAQRVLDLVDNLLDIARLQSGKIELTRVQVELQKMVGVVINDFLPQSIEYGVILQNQIPTDWPTFFIDHTKITRVFTNLIDNALKYSPSGTPIAITGEINPQNTACIRISDRGPGIPQEYREKIFERFGQIPGARGRRRGTGLGLTFCKLAVEAHGGQIWVETNAHGGSDFVFTLPLDDR